MMCRCPDCNWFLGKVRAIQRKWDDHIFVMGWCKRCGWRTPTNWDAEDFDFEEVHERIRVDLCPTVTFAT